MDGFAVIDAFVDGERVDAAALKHALSEPAGRDYLVDIWLLREGVQEEMKADTAAPPASLPTRSPRTWLYAAAMLVCVIGGYAIGYQMSGPGSQQPVPVTPPAANAQPASAPPAPLAAPVPTRVITVQFAADTTAGGGD